MTKGSDERAERIVNGQIDPEQWHAGPDHTWLLTRDDQRGLIYQCETEFGLVTFIVHEPERAAGKLLAWSEQEHRVTLTGPDGETISGTDVGDDLSVAIEANAAVAFRYWYWLLGYNAAELLEDTVNEALCVANINAQSHLILTLKDTIKSVGGDPTDLELTDNTPAKTAIEKTLEEGHIKKRTRLLRITRGRDEAVMRAIKIYREAGGGLDLDALVGQLNTRYGYDLTPDSLGKRFARTIGKWSEIKKKLDAGEM